MTQADPHIRTEDETLSAFLDGELSGEMAATVLKRLAGSDAERTRLTEYWAVGDALRGLSGQAPNLTQRVMAALDDEPTILAPMRKPRNRQPALWLAAATVAAIAWSLWSVDPRTTPDAQMAATVPDQTGDVMPYLAAHQDFAQAMVSTPEMNFTRVNLVEAGR